MKIGVPKEIKNHEYRVGATPSDVAAYIRAGHSVLVEKSAGIGAGFSDEEYQKAGAVLEADASKVWNGSQMIIKVKEPLPQEYQYFREDLLLYTYLHLASAPELTDALLKAKVNSVPYETITDQHGALPCLMPMSAIAGRLAVMQGSNYLLKHYGGNGILLGGVSSVDRAHVVIVGAGVVGSNAIQMAVGLGARVTILDINLPRLAHIEEVYGNKVTTLYSSEANMEKSLASADLVIGAVLVPGLSAPKLIRREHLNIMKKNAVIVDVAIDQGGCAESSHATTHAEPTYIVDDVIHYCVANMPGAVANTSTLALTATTLRYGLSLAADFDKAMENPHLRNGLNTYQGNLTCEAVAQSLAKPYTPYSK